MATQIVMHETVDKKGNKLMSLPLPKVWLHPSEISKKYNIKTLVASIEKILQEI